MLALTTSKSGPLVGVFISVTTVPAVGTLALCIGVGVWSEIPGALAQLGVNLAGMVLVRHRRPCSSSGPSGRGSTARSRLAGARRVRPVTTARVVPVTTEMDGDELDAEDAWHLSRRIGLRRLLLDSFVRFRYADGFSHSRALALQVALAVVPFLLALSGLAADIDHERPGPGGGPHHRAALPRRRVARRARRRR